VACAHRPDLEREKLGDDRDGKVKEAAQAIVID
jgi:hypothetical protein